MTKERQGIIGWGASPAIRPCGAAEIGGHGAPGATAGTGTYYPDIADGLAIPG